MFRWPIVGLRTTNLQNTSQFFRSGHHRPPQSWSTLFRVPQGGL